MNEKLKFKREELFFKYIDITSSMIVQSSSQQQQQQQQQGGGGRRGGGGSEIEIEGRGINDDNEIEMEENIFQNFHINFIEITKYFNFFHLYNDIETHRNHFFKIFIFNFKIFISFSNISKNKKFEYFNLIGF